MVRVCSIRVMMAFLFILAVLLTQAQRPKVGIALAGGGAKGLAHIGILKAIDSAGLKIDYITGTSMGAIIGSLYAAGYSGKDIEQISLRLDWDNLFKNSANFKDIALAEKDEYNGYVVEVPVYKFKLATNSGLLNPEGIWVEFLKYLYPVYDVKNFHKLNIPFECLATDLETGQPVVLDKGEIVQAIRASMAIPSVFTPVTYNDKMLVDGGVVRNFPVRYIKEMGADYLIGVSLWDGLLKKHQIKNAFDVFNQITSYIDAEDSKEEKAMCDILISPPIEPYTAASFGDFKDIIRIGNEEGEKMYPVFKRLADSLNALEPVRYNPYGRLPSKKNVTVDKIEVVGLSGAKARQLISSTGLEEGKTYSPRRLSAAISIAYSSLNYKYLFYELYPTDIPDHARLVLVTEEDFRQWVKLGLFYNNFLGAAVTVNYTLRNYKHTNSRSFVKLSVGDNLDLTGQSRYHWGDKLRNQIQGELRVTDLKIPIFEGTKKLFVYNTTYSSLDFSYMRYLDKYTGVGAGIAYKWKHYSPDISSAIRYRGNETQFYLHINQLTSTYDRRYFTTSGVLSSFEGGFIFGRNTNNSPSGVYMPDSLFLKNSQKPYFRLKYELTAYKPVSARTSISGSLQFGSLLNHQGVYFNEFFLGGDHSLFRQQVPFVGLRDAQIIVDSYTTAMVGLQHNLFSNVFVSLSTNYGYYNFIKKNTYISSSNTNKHILGIGLSAGYFLSKWPLQASVSYSPQMKKLYGGFSIGYAFF